MEAPKRENDRSARALTAQAMGLGVQLVAGMIAFTWLGWWVDQRRGGGSACTLAGIFLGLLYMGYEVWKLVRQVR